MLIIKKACFPTGLNLMKSKTTKMFPKKREKYLLEQIRYVEVILKWRLVGLD